MASRTLDSNHDVKKLPSIAPSAGQLALAGISGHTLEKWGDFAYWDATSSKAISVDKLNITGTPRSQDGL